MLVFSCNKCLYGKQPSGLVYARTICFLILPRKIVNMSTKFLLNMYVSVMFKDRLDLIGIVRKDTLDADMEVRSSNYKNMLYVTNLI